MSLFIFVKKEGLNLSDMNLGLGIIFDQSSLQSLNSILTYVQKIQKQFESMGDPLNGSKGPKKALIDMNAELQKLNTQAMKSIKTVEDIGKSATETFKGANNQLVQVTKNTDGVVTSLKNIHTVNKSIGEEIGHNISKMVSWGLSAAAIYGTINALKQALQTISDFETSGIHVQRVLPSGANMNTIIEGAKRISVAYGESLNDTMKASEGWARKFKDVNDVVNMTNASLRLIAVTDINLSDSFKNLSAIMTQFNLTAGSSTHVVDSLNEMSNNLRTTAQDVAAGLARMGSAAKMMSIDFDRATAMVAVGVETTGASGEQIGTALNRMLSRFHAPNAIKALKQVGIDAFQPISKSLDELGLHWKEYSQAEQEAIAKSLGGVVQWQKTAAILQNYNRVIEATLLSYNSFGSAQKEIDLDMSTYQKKVDQLNASLQVLAVSLGNGVLPELKLYVDQLRTITDLFGKIPINIVPAIKGMLNPIGNIIDAFSSINSSFINNKLVDPMTSLGKSEQQVSYMKERSNQINYLSDMHEKLYEKLQKLNPKTKEYAETLSLYEKVQSQVVQLGNEFNIAKDPTLSKYEGEKKQIDSLIQKITELDKKRQDSFKKELDNQINSLQKNENYEQKLMDLKSQYYDDWRKLRTENPGSLNYKTAQNDIGQLRQQMLGWVSNNPNMNAQQKMANSLSINTDTTKWLKDQQKYDEQLLQAINDLKKKRDGIGLIDSTFANSEDNGYVDKPEKMQATITNLTQQILDSIAAAATKWDEQNAKIAASNGVKLPNNLTPINTQVYYPNATGNLTPYSMNVSPEALSKFTSIGQRLMAIVNDMSKVDDAVNDIQNKFDLTVAQYQNEGKTFKNTTAEVNIRKQMDSSYDVQVDKMQNYIKELENQSIVMGESSYATHELINAQIKLASIEWMRKNNVNQLVEAESKMKQQQAWHNLTNSALDTLTQNLQNLGGAAAIAGTLIQTAAKNLTFEDGKFKFDLKSFGIDILSQGINWFINGLFNPQRYKAYERDKYSLTESYNAMQENQGRLEQITGYRSQIKKGNDNIAYAQAHPFQGSTEYIRNMQQQIANWQLNIKMLNDQILQNLDSWKKAIGVTIDDLANNLADAFQADKYVDFLQNWNQSLYQMTKDALIKGFLASSAFQPLYEKLSDTIAMSVLDGTLTASEIASIKMQGTDIAKAMQTLYSALDLLKSSFPDNGSNNGNSNNSYTAGSVSNLTINNYVTVSTLALMGNEDDARRLSLMVKDYIVAEEQRG